MDNKSFSEADKDKVIDFLNLVATKAEFTLKTEEVIKFYKLLAHMQQIVLPKIDAHILEVKRVVKPDKAEPKKHSKKSKKV